MDHTNVPPSLDPATDDVMDVDSSGESLSGTLNEGETDCTSVPPSLDPATDVRDTGIPDSYGTSLSGTLTEGEVDCTDVPPSLDPVTDERDADSSGESLRYVHLMSEDEQVNIAMRLSLGEGIPIPKTYSSVVHVKKEPGSRCGCGSGSGCEDCRDSRKPGETKHKVSAPAKSVRRPTQRRRISKSSTSSSDDDDLQIVSESYSCHHCDAVFASKKKLEKHVEAVELANVYRYKSIGTDSTGASYIKDSYIKPICLPKKKKRHSSPVRISKEKKKKKVQKVQAKRDGPTDWHVLESKETSSSEGKQPQSGSSSDSESESDDKTEPTKFKRWIVFRDSKSTFFTDSRAVTKSIFNANNDIVNKTVPLRCDENYAFMIDTRKLQHPGDLTCDDTGKYNKPTYSKTEVELENEVFTLCRKYLKHKDTPGFQRSYYELQKDGKRAHHVVIVRYEWKGAKGQLKMTPHGGCKDTKNAEPFVRSSKTLLTSLKTEKNRQGSAQSMINKMFEEEGGSEKIESFSSVPRDSNQVYRHSSTGKRVSRFDKILEMNMNGDFVKSVEFFHDGTGPKPHVFLCSKRQAKDIETFCCDDKSILSIDPTYDLGPFLLTASSYRHPKYVNKGNGKNVLMPGPMMVHAKRDTETYSYFANRLSTVLGNKTINFHGTDNEKALVNGLHSASSFKESKHLLCMQHHKQNCDKKLQTLGVVRNKRRILRSIYGETVDNVRHEGLVDCGSHEEFDQNLLVQKQLWEELEVEDTGKSSQFYQWFVKHKSHEVKTTMLKSIRSEANVGSTQYTTNDCEALNAMIKRWTGKKKMTWDDICTTLQAFVESKYKVLELALHGSGDRRLSKPFAHLQMNKVQWTSLSSEERREHVEKAEVSIPTEECVLSIAAEECRSSEERREHVEKAEVSIPTEECMLSIAAEECRIGGFTIHELREVWQKAANLLSERGTIIAVPNKTDAYMCFGDEVPIGVVKKKNRFVCETSKCKTFVFHDKLFCQHTIAVAEKCGVLSEFIAAINAHKRSSTVNLVNNLLHQQCDGSGKKKNASKRKGPNNTLSQQVERTVPLMQTTDVPAHHTSQPVSSSQPVSTPQPFSVFLKSGLIRMCYGCNQAFSERMNTPPNDLILRRFDYREWYDAKKGEKRRNEKLTHTYYHLGMDCVRRRYPYTQVKDIIVYDEVLATLTEEHKKKLQKFGIQC